MYNVVCDVPLREMSVNQMRMWAMEASCQGIGRAMGAVMGEDQVG